MPNPHEQPDRLLLELYRRGERFIELTELGDFGAPQRVRTLLADLERRGVRLERRPAAVRLVRPVRPMPALIEAELQTRRVGRCAICFDEVASTNDVAFDSAAQPNADGLAVLAERQRAGRGRRGRTWLSPPGAGLLMSVLLVDPAGTLPSEALTLAAGLATAEAVEGVAGLGARLKWPNDVLAGEAKLAGVLVETRSRPGGGRNVVVGVGVNVSQAPPPEAVDRPAASLFGETGAVVERVELARCLLRRLDGWVARLGEGVDAELHRRWMDRCGMLNRRVEVAWRGRTLTGRVLDVDPLWGLVLADDAGREHRIPAAEASMR